MDVGRHLRGVRRPGDRRHRRQRGRERRRRSSSPPSGQSEYAFSVVLNSPIQIALVLAPVLVIISQVFGLAVADAGVSARCWWSCLVLAVILAAFIAFDGESTWLEGAVAGRALRDHRHRRSGGGSSRLGRGRAAMRMSRTAPSPRRSQRLLVRRAVDGRHGRPRPTRTRSPPSASPRRLRRAAPGATGRGADRRPPPARAGRGRRTPSSGSRR